jgi:hypothetical protein
VGESTDVQELPVCRPRQLDGRRAWNHAEHIEGNVFVRMRMNYNISLFAAAVAAMAIATAPNASAASSERPVRHGGIDRLSNTGQRADLQLASLLACSFPPLQQPEVARIGL